MAGVDAFPQFLHLAVRLSPTKHIKKYRRSYPPEELPYSHLSYLIVSFRTTPSIMIFALESPNFRNYLLHL